MEAIQFWHMQMFPSCEPDFAEKIPFILQHKKFIRLGDWEEHRNQIPNFCEKMKINDVVAIKNGKELIALVQIIGGMYEVYDDSSEFGWMIYRRPIRVLDWEIEQRDLPHSRGTVNPCVSDDAETTKVIRDWYEKVKLSFEKRKISILI